jgi:adenosylmethionine-8-amino-7-oxononanoate aminotransferase
LTDPVDTLLAQDRAHIWHPFTQAQTADPPIPVVSGKGATLLTADGREIVDLISSWWVNIHGHAHPKIAQAIAEQATRLEQVIFADFTHAPAVTLAERLAAILPGGLSRVFFSDNGSTSVEIALKLAWQYWINTGEAHRNRYLAFEGAYHGDTFGAMSAGASSGFYDPFKPLLFQVDTIPFPETWLDDGAVEAKETVALAALDAWLFRHGAELAAFIAEPLIQGAAGMRMCRPSFMAQVVERIRAVGGLVIFDEVMTGFGRTGATFASDVIGVAPDLICLSKGLTGGFLPLSVTVCGERIYEAFLGGGFERAFAHGHSFTANPLGCAAALASLDLTLAPETAQAWQRIEARHRQGLAQLARVPTLKHFRMTGTIAACDLDIPGTAYGAALGRQLKKAFLARGLLIRPLGPVLYLLPPYCITDAELDRAYAAIAEVVTTVSVG